MKHSSDKMDSPNIVSGESYHGLIFNLPKQDLISDDTPEYVYSDTSLEENDLNINSLQNQINVDNLYLTDERYIHIKKENFAFQTRIHTLEEQLHDAELRCKEHLASEERRHRELVAHIHRSTRLSIDNYATKLQSIEEANESLQLEVIKYKSSLETTRNEKTSLERKLSDLEEDAQLFKDKIYTLELELRKLKLREKDNEKVIKQLTIDLDMCHSEKEMMTTEFTAQLESLKYQNLNLKDSFDELQASTVSEDIKKNKKLQAKTQSLAAEFDELAYDGHKSLSSLQINKLKTALKHQQETNEQLRAYINNILTFR